MKKIMTILGVMSIGLSAFAGIKNELDAHSCKMRITYTEPSSENGNYRAKARDYLPQTLSAGPNSAVMAISHDLGARPRMTFKTLVVADDTLISVAFHEGTADVGAGRPSFSGYLSIKNTEANAEGNVTLLDLPSQSVGINGRVKLICKK